MSNARSHDNAICLSENHPRRWSNTDDAGTHCVKLKVWSYCQSHRQGSCPSILYKKFPLQISLALLEGLSFLNLEWTVASNHLKTKKAKQKTTAYKRYFILLVCFQFITLLNIENNEVLYFSKAVLDNVLKTTHTHWSLMEERKSQAVIWKYQHSLPMWGVGTRFVKPWTQYKQKLTSAVS